ncbi:MAG TPA: PDDEXK nuclease domain-containing protein [Methanocorpusculum sp.]|nr:PDDEXK nuclease domain-containing protein [Methanocorpusculum sp.]
MSEIFSAEYTGVVSEIISGVRQAQQRALLSVNRELVLLYWNVGKIILERAEWGSKFIENLSADIRKEFPELTGFSPRNLKNMKRFAEMYPSKQIVQTLSAQLPWSHTVLVMERVKKQEIRDWYLMKAIENGWSVRVLDHQIATDLYKRQGKTLEVSNFEKVLPQKNVSALFKDPYVFDFLSFSNEVSELEVEDALVSHVTKLLLEFGCGFAFVGRQVHLEVGGEDFYMDLLFYHLKLHCYVVVELKTGKFKPEYAGKMNFYLSAVDDLIKSDADAPSIGLILCRDKQKFVAEYALRDLKKPIGVSEYAFSQELPEMLRKVLPDTEEIEGRMVREMEAIYQKNI